MVFFSQHIRTVAKDDLVGGSGHSLQVSENKLEEGDLGRAGSKWEESEAEGCSSSSLVHTSQAVPCVKSDIKRDPSLT